MTEEDRQRFVRVPIRLECEYWSDPPPIKAVVSDLGEGGAFIDTPNPLPQKEIVFFRLHLPDEQTAVEGRAEVIWRQPTVGMGIEFRPLADEDRERIKFLIASEFFKRPGESG